MAHGQSDAEIIAHTRNTARFFTETRHVAWVLMIATIAWGAYGYLGMPKRKDPEVPWRVAMVVAPWPGAPAEKIEQLVTRKIEEKIAENSKVDRIESVSRTSVSVVYVSLQESVTDRAKEFEDIRLRLDTVRDLPAGAGPISLYKEFGETAALALTVASPKVTGVELALRARAVRETIEQTRARGQGDPNARATMVAAFPPSVNPRTLQRFRDLVAREATAGGWARDARPIDGSGFVGLDAVMNGSDQTILAALRHLIRDRLRLSEIHPDVWQPVIVRRPEDAEATLAAVAGDKYSHRDLEEYTDLIKRTIQTVPHVSKVTRTGILHERIFLEYSQERLASYGLQPSVLTGILSARNITLPGGVLEIGERSVTLDPTGEFKTAGEIGNVLVAASSSGSPVYLRDVVDISRDYENPPGLLNFYTWRDANGEWRRSRAITLAVHMRPGEQIAAFGDAVNVTLQDLRRRLPPDLILARTSDQPLQVAEGVNLFMRSLYEAIILVVLVALVGFWEWRSALLMALSVPLTLAMTFGMMHMLGIDLQQVSIASLIIALGLLVDDPVVAGDAIKRELAAGHPPAVAAWLGPTRLANAIMFATVTNIVAYLPMLLVRGDTGRFISSLPVVLACSLVASRIVSMTFIPLLGYYLLRASARPVPSAEERRTRGFAGFYYRVGGFALAHRWLVLVGSLGLLAVGTYGMSHIKTQFFPKDLSYLSYVDVWLPQDAPLPATNEAATRAEAIIRTVAAEYARRHPGKGDAPGGILTSLTTFVGGGGPKFWFSVVPEPPQPNYAQVLIQVKDKHDTSHLVVPLQKALVAGVPGARVDVRQLETAAAVGIPVAVRLSGQDIPTLRQWAARVADIFRALPQADRVRDDWGEDSFVVKLQVDPDRANLAGVSNLDVAASSAAGMNGFQVTSLRVGDKQIPVMVRLRMEERARLADVQNLYVYAMQGAEKVPLRQVSSIDYGMETPKLRRRSQFYTVTVAGFPVPGALPSEVLNAARPQLLAVARALPPGYRLEIGGEEEEQRKGFNDLAIVMAISVVAIFLTLVLQFKNAVKPFIVFAAIPFGIVGAVAALAVTGAPFGFMAFLGIASLVGVIVSHVIVLFDFIEEMHAKGEPLREALLDAGIVRLRPVLITVGATVFGLVPLALHGGPLWEPLCYTQIGGLVLATFITLLLVPVLYAILVLDLKLIRWYPSASV